MGVVVMTTSRPAESCVVEARELAFDDGSVTTSSGGDESSSLASFIASEFVPRQRRPLIADCRRPLMEHAPFTGSMLPQKLTMAFSGLAVAKGVEASAAFVPL